MTVAWLSVTFIVGLVAGDIHAAPLTVCVGATVACAAAAVLIRARLLIPLLIASAFCLGLARVPHASPPGPADLAYYTGKYVQLQGTISAEPDMRDTGSNYRVTISGLIRNKAIRPVHGTLAVHTTRAVQLDFGDSVTVTGHLLRARPTDGPGIGAEMRFPRLLDAGATNTGFFGLLNRFRQWLEDGINHWLPEPEAALLIAITLGAKSATLGTIAPTLVKTGLIHLVAISGIKVAMVAGTIHQLARRSGSRNLTLALSLAALFAYVLLTGASPASLRSAGMWTMIFLASYFGRGTLSVVSLSLVVALMLGHDPSLVYDLGFQMSVAGTAGIIVLSGPILRRFRRIPSPFAEALATSVAAQLYTIPIVIEGFHVQSTIGPVANTLVLPLLPLLILLGFALGCVAGVAPIASPLGAVSYALVHLIVMGAGLLSNIPVLDGMSTWSANVVVPYYCVLITVSVWVLRRLGWAPVGAVPHLNRELTLAVVAACSFLTYSVVSARTAQNSGIYWLGSGNAVLVQSQGMYVLIDGSPRPLELLDRLGSVLPGSGQSLDAVIVTDPRAANVGGLVDILRHYFVSEVIDVGAEYPSSTYARWRAEVRNLGIPTFELRTGVSVQVGAAHILAVGPESVCPLSQNCAGLLRLTLSKSVYLLAGSASVREEHEAVFRGVPLRANLLLCGGVPPDPAFVEAVLGRSRTLSALPTDHVTQLNP